MILVDSSVWVDYFNGTPTAETDFLDARLSVELIAIGDLMLAEVLQGFRDDRDFRRARSLLSAFSTPQLLDAERAVRVAENYRRLRKLGVTVRKTTDMIIGTWCIDTSTSLLFSDRDFDPMIRHLGLRSALVEGS